MSDLAVAAVLAGAILLASSVSVELGISVALIELFAGVVVGERPARSTSPAGSRSSGRSPASC